MDKQSQRRLRLHDVARYEIWVQGCLHPSWCRELEMQIVQIRSELGLTTRLVGELRDQAALVGMLQHLYELGFPLLRVSYMPQATELSDLQPAPSGAP
ncbi:MAG: hypothetical protein HGA45_04755 [Chloroflexales bacterium]|nr:hypothetical protein [Chloroflexales bacterium]